MYATFERFKLRITKEQALSASHQGPCDEDIKALLKVGEIAIQLHRIQADKIRAELKECGAWTDEELSDNQANRERILWIACCNIREELNERSRGH